jgi:hypothetical protein
MMPGRESPWSDSMGQMEHFQLSRIACPFILWLHYISSEVLFEPPKPRHFLSPLISFLPPRGCLLPATWQGLSSKKKKKKKKKYTFWLPPPEA